MKKILYAIFVLAILQSCNNVEQNNSNPAVNDTSVIVADSTAMHREDLFKDVVFDSKKDFVCGMPISAGVSDTAHYKEKVYGFCSSECKAEFVKNPSSFIAAK